ncbi:MAG: hypothetical protein COV91_04395 [Candidatus Taylorbacteria bacterium CG11_big_fil_rev_8_21_14_0_20_46_11]|uniref:Protein kinase domain-containing protein n=1 Tax=Candidatus Taylorbacteria bacterium CG11_big_fil_rev_8_21_14_0_20_46_11 TaxID=1975025 RepID=A0A2H0KAW8_9BACT|nr:MAG: hypothetical protein COV91_04395 [Candidatus Taylorbacteria bacterium CG11_big_fil_rev_8_21_14_0_20_46_11]
MKFEIENKIASPEIQGEILALEEERVLRELEEITSQTNHLLGEGKTAEVWPLKGSEMLCMKVVDSDRLENMYENGSLPPFNSPEIEFDFLERVKEVTQAVHIPVPHLVLNIHTDEDRHVRIIVMEKLKAISLKDVHEGAPLPKNFNMTTFFARLRASLEQLHEAGIHHRDIAESNIMVMEETGDPCLIDFGDSASVMEGESPYTIRDDFGRVFRTYPNDKRSLGEVEKRLTAKLGTSLTKSK